MKQLFFMISAFALVWSTVWATSENTLIVKNTKDNVSTFPLSSSLISMKKSEHFKDKSLAGYIAGKNLAHPRNVVTSVRGEWYVPTIKSTDTLNAGVIVSVNNGQIGLGTISGRTLATKQTNYPFYQVPSTQAIYPIPLSVSPGDYVTSLITFDGTYYRLFLNNITQTTAAPTVTLLATDFPTQKNNIASLIVGDPNFFSGQYMDTLANFGKITFYNCLSTINGIGRPISNSSWPHALLTMMHTGTPSYTKAFASKLHDSGTSFTVQFAHP